MFIENSGKHVADILSRTECTKHKVPNGIPCWHIPIDGFGYRAALCGKRIKLAGYAGKISAMSMQQKSSANKSRAHS
jgi:hypothetical protein